MKNYKGYNKLPYCRAHYPTTRFTAVAETPENLRLAKQQKNQSEIVYRKGKEDALREFTQVADSVSTKQALHSGAIASDLRYQTMPFEVGREGKPDAEIVNRPAEGQASQPAAVKKEPTNDAPEPKPAAPAAAPEEPVKVATPEPVAPAAAPAPVPAPAPPAPAKKPAEYIAIFDYTAADDDEITILENDELIDTLPIDEGWMEGRNARTGLYGMFPSNYVKKA